MGYVQIGDPNIIDVANWQQLISAVDANTAAIGNITDKFGANGGTVKWEETNYSGAYTMGSQKIIYGRTKIDTATAANQDSKNLFYGTVNFLDANGSGADSFTNKPLVIATIEFGSATLPATEITKSNASIAITTWNVNKDSFSWRVTNPKSSATGTKVPLGSFFFINWIAIGPKSN
jgi:hypothetical protein